MPFRHLVQSALLAAVALALGAPAAPAEPAAGVIQGANTLVTFDTTAPGTFTSVKPITGVEGGLILDVDYRYHPGGTAPPPPQLFGVAVEHLLEDELRLYSIDVETGVATPVGTGFGSTPVGNTYGIDFNSGVDRLRVINDLDANFRINPSTGALIVKDALINPGGEKVSGVAYDRVDFPTPLPLGSTTAYAIGVLQSRLFTLGSLNGVPISPNNGNLLPVGQLGVTLTPNTPVGFDIDRAGTAFATMVVDGHPGLYTVNLETGVATLVGGQSATLSGFAIVPVGPKVTPPADTTAPSIALAGVGKKLSFKAFLKGIAVKVTPSEPASLAGELLGAALKKKRLASFTRSLAKASLPLAAGRRTLKLKPRKKAVGMPSKAFKVKLRVTATDAAGNVGAVLRTITVKPPLPATAKASRAGR